MTGPAGALDVDLLRSERVVAILRSDSPAHLPATVATLAGAGIHLIELALTTPGAAAALAAISADLPDGVHLGAGTVLSPDLARKAIDAGATFLVTPAFSAAVIGYASAQGVPVISGAFTPTEVLAAWDAGATAVKLFPASVGGPSYCRALRDPLPSIPLVPTGGVGAANAAEYLAAGALALGVGRSLTGDATEGGSLAELAARAADLLAVVRPAVPPVIGRRPVGGVGP